MKTIRSLESLELIDMGISCCVDHDHDKVKHVDIEHMSFMEKVKPIPETLYYTFRDHKRLKNLNISNNNMVNFEFINKLVEETKTLKEINLEGNEISHPDQWFQLY